MPQNPIDLLRRQQNADLMAPNQFQAPMTPSILDADPGTFGAGRDDLTERYSTAAALKGLQLANQGKQQQIDAADPAQQRVKKADDLAFDTGLIGNGETDAVDSHALQNAMKKLGLENELKLQYEGDPRHLAPVEIQTQGKTMDALIAAGAKENAQPKPLDASTTNKISSLENFKLLAGQIMPMLDQLDQHASEYRSLPMASKAVQVLKGGYNNYLYNHGMPADDVQGKVQQLVALAQGLQIAGMTTGRPSTAWMDLLKKHLADPSQPPGEIKSKIQELLELAPGFEQNILNSRNGLINQPQNGGAGRGTDPMGIR